MVGLLVLIALCLSYLHVFLSRFTIPAHVANRLEKLQWDSLWGGLGDESKIHLIGWNVVCSIMVNGGLGVKKLSTFNKALLGKWLWHFGEERDLLWRWVIGVFERG